MSDILYPILRVTKVIILWCCQRGYLIQYISHSYFLFCEIPCSNILSLSVEEGVGGDCFSYQLRWFCALDRDFFWIFVTTTLPFYGLLFHYRYGIFWGPEALRFDGGKFIVSFLFCTSVFNGSIPTERARKYCFLLSSKTVLLYFLHLT